jgi:hypothetical protein
MNGIIRNERGSALVTTLFFLLGLAVTGAIIAGVASSERRVTHNEYSHTRAVNASDAGGEVGISWIFERDVFVPPLEAPGTTLLDVTTPTPITSAHALGENNEYTYDVVVDGVTRKGGWGREVLWGQYTVSAEGATTQDNTAVIEVQADRMFIVNLGN